MSDQLPETILAFERAYVARARAELGAATAGVAAISLGRSPEAQPALAGWWAEPAEGLVLLPNPWDDRAAIADFEAHCWQEVQRAVQRLAPVLDELLATARGADGWDLVLGPWLAHVVAAVADRRLYCVAAAELAPGVPFATEAPDAAPATMGEGVERLRTEEGNRRLMSAIVAALGLPAAQRAFAAPADEQPGSGAGAGIARELRARPVHHLARVGAQALLSVPAGRRATLLGQVGLSPSDALRLAVRVPWVRGDRPPVLRGSLPVAPQERPDLRARLAGEGLLGGLLPRLMPRSVLEGHAELQAASRRRYGRPSHLLIGNYAADEVQNDYIDRCRAAGRRFAFVQHGGFYLQARVNGQERLERRPGTEFLTWGSAEDGARPMPNPKLERIRDTHEGGDAVVIIEFLEPPDTYVIRFASQPMANQALAPAAMLAEFAGAVDGARERLVLKRFPSHLDARQHRPPALEALPHAYVPGGAVEWMQRARVAVLSYPDTPFIEAMVLGVPAIGLWDPSQWELRDDAQPAFDALTQAGIVHADPRAAAKHLDAIYADPASWWESETTRAARGAFIDRFARPGEWLDAWAAYLRGLAR